MKFVTTMTWPAPLARVLAMISSTDYAHLRLSRMGYEAFEVLSTSDDGRHFSLTALVTGKPSVKLPALAQKFINSDQPIVVEQTDRWDRETASGTLQLINKSVSALSIAASMQLSECEGVTTNTLHWDVSCSIPLIGGKLASIIADDIRAKAAQNETVSREIFAERYENLA